MTGPWVRLALVIVVCVGRLVGGADASSGYHYQSAEIRALQDDDFANPGMLWVDRGRELYAEDSAGASCASCHGPRGDDLVGAATRYPLVRRGVLLNLEGQINRCRTERQGSPGWAYESAPLLAMTSFVANLSTGLPMQVAVEGVAAPYFAMGEATYRTRRGQLDLACFHCHEQNVGRMLRGDRLSEGQSVGYPIYRLDWQTQGSLHRRLRTCFEGVRSETYPLGAPVYVALELYLAHRARGLPVETPAIRR